MSATPKDEVNSPASSPWRRSHPSRGAPTTNVGSSRRMTRPPGPWRVSIPIIPISGREHQVATHAMTKSLAVCIDIGMKLATRTREVSPLALVLATGCLDTPDPPACSPPRALAINTAADEVSPWLSADRLELLFASDRSGDLDLYRSTRATVLDDFVDATPLAIVNGARGDSDPFMTDEQTLWFTSDRGTVGNFRLFRATRTTLTGAFETVDMVDSAGDVWRPSFTSDGLTMYSHKPSSPRSVYRTSRTSTDSLAFEVPQALPVDGERIESPWIVGDGSRILYATEVDGVHRIVTAVREGAGFGAATPVMSAAPATEASDPALNADGLTLAFTSDRAEADGQRDIYLACE